MKIVKHITLTLVLVSTLISTNAYSANTWNLVKQQNGIQLFFRDHPGSNVPEFKTTMTVTAEIDELLAVLNNPETCSEWVYQCRKGMLLEQVSENEQYLYQVNDLPFMFRDRDMIFYARLEMVVPHEEYNIIFRIDSKYCETAKLKLCQEINNSNLISIESSHGTYHLKKVEGGKVEIVWQQHIDPALSLPRWLIMSQLEKVPFYTMRNLRNRL